MSRSHIDAHGRPVVVVTGTGVVTSLGAGKTDNWCELTAGHSGIHRISRFPDWWAAHQHRGDGGFRAGGRTVLTGAVGTPRRTGDGRSNRRSRYRFTGRLSRSDVPCSAARGNGMDAARCTVRCIGRQRGSDATMTCCVLPALASSSATTNASCSVRCRRTWQRDLVRRGRRYRPRRPVPRARRLFNWASRRSVAARPMRHSFAAQMHPSTQRA